VWRLVVALLLAPLIAASVRAEGGSAPVPAPRPVPVSASASGTAVQALRVRFAPEADYGPFVFQAADGRVQGLSVELLERLTATLGWQLQMLPPRPLSENLAAARRGEVDLISSLRPTLERAQYLTFSPPYVSVPAVLVRRRGTSGDGLSGYEGRSVAVGDGYAVQAHVAEFHPRVLWRAVPDDAQALGLLHRGEVSAAVMDVASARFLMRQLGFEDLEVGARIGFDYALCFAWRRDRPEIGVALQRALAALPIGERDALTERWLGGPPEDAPDSSRRWLVRWGMATMALGALGWWLSALRRRQRRAARRGRPS
jgi:ABC-type amino acid transport substrate-binding protein